MMDLLAWQRLTVEEFFQRHSWPGSTRSQVTPNHGGVEEPAVAERVVLVEVTQPNWQRLSVGEFLQRWNWQAIPQHLSSAEPTVSLAPVSTEEMTEARPESIASSSWLQLPVQAFIDGIPWQAQPQRKVASPPAPSLDSPAVPSEPTTSQFSPPLPTLAWQSLTVQEFFTQNAWSGQAIAPPVAQTEFRPAQSSLKATVAQFFQAFPWESIPSIAALPALEPLTPPQQPDLSLNDLSDLF
uniref:Uncharacterized protein n=1 Tax=Cyanothece sp. (strain PCC 7425 / ATCC 29141) TaxID=395961 RepID=B8HN31_CYAP4